MVANALTTELIEGGKGLLEELDSSGIKVDGALWFYFSQEGFWKLVLSLPDVKKIGPKAVYAKIQKALSRSKHNEYVSLDDVALAKPDAPVILLLRTVIHTGKGIGGMRLSNNVINGHVIEDAYIYRL